MIGEQLLRLLPGQRLVAQRARPILAHKGVVGQLRGRLRRQLLQRHAHALVQLPPLIEQQRLVGHIARHRMLEQIDQPLQHLQPREVALLQQA